MAKSRKDNKGRVLRKGETFRKSDGRYQYSYKDIYGDRRFIYSNDLNDLRQKEKEVFKDQLDEIDISTASRMTLNEMYDKYMSTRHDLAPRTYAGYIYQYNAHVKDALGKRTLKGIKYSDILAFYLDLINEKHLSIGTVERLHRVIHPALDMAVRDCIIRNNPSDKVIGIVKKQTGATRGIRKALTPEEQKAFLEFMDGHPVFDHWKPLYTFLLGTGLRVGEFSSLTWDDINFEKCEITVDHALVYFAGKLNKTKKRVFISTPKTEAGIRKVPIVPEVKNALEKVKEFQKENELVCNVTIDDMTDFVFLNRFGGVYLQSSLDRNLERIIDAYNDYEIHEAAKAKRNPLVLPHFTCHSLRHTFCTRLCENETNLKVIQSIMGHTDIKTTMDIYAEVSEAKKKEALNALSDKLNLF